MGPELRVRLLGGLVVEGVDARRLGSRKGRTVLKALALGRGRPVAVDRIGDIVWGDARPASPGAQLGVLVSRLRGVLGQDRVTRTDAGGYRGETALTMMMERTNGGGSVPR